MEIKKIPPLASKQLEPLLIPIEDIRPHPDNYKVHPPEQLRSLKASLKTFSWTTPIKANLEGFIIAGHGMYKAAIEEGYTHVPVEFCALDKQLSKAYLVADNETARRAVTEQDKLNELLEGALSIPDFDIEAVGFSSEDIDTLLKSGEPVEVVEDEFNEDDVGEGRCKEGDLWQLGRHRLLCGDSTKKEDVDMLLEDVKIDLLLTDPPFFTPATHYQSRKKYQRKFSDLSSLGGFLDKVMLVIKPHLKQESHVCIFCNCDSYAVFYPILFSMFDKTKSLVWDKCHVGLGRIFRHQHELIIWGRNEGHYFELDGDLHSDVLSFEATATKDREHPVEKPISLVSELIKPLTPDNSIVCDLFLGGGGVLISCEQLNRTCYGMELDPHYCDVILSRWEQFTNQTAKKLN